MNWANALTLSRFVFAIIICILLLQHSLMGYVLAAFCFLLAALTDLYDGYIARQMKLTSSFGKIMDPIADKALMLTVFSALTFIEGVVQPWMVVVIAIREIWITADRLMVMRQGKVIAAERAGKIKTVLQMSSVGVILLYLIANQAGWFLQIQPAWLGFIHVLMVMTVFVTVGSGAAYFRSKKDLA